MADNQVIPARHGVATFVPAGQTIRIINTSGSQVVDTWAFALPANGPGQGDDNDGDAEADPKSDLKSASEPQKKKPTKGADLPEQEEAEQRTKDAMKNGKEEEAAAKSSWSSYVPSLGLTSSSKKDTTPAKKDESKSSKGWSSYLPSGQSFSSYIPKTATDTVSTFAKDHKRNPKKSYLEQLQDFSKTPVGATGLAALTGSGYSGSLYAGYQAWNVAHAANGGAMEYMSMSHTRAGTLNLRPRVNDKFLTNIREPILTLIEDTSPGVHDTLIPACDPSRYKGLGADQWEKHGSCAENLVLALKELNERAGLQGARAVGADVTMNNVPAPLNLFMNVPWDDDGDLGFQAPRAKAGDYVRLKAERDVVIVMSACPQDILDVNGRHPTDAHFIVEDAEPTKAALRRTRKAPPKKAAPKAASTQSASTTAATNGPRPTKKPVPKQVTAPKKAAPSTSNPPAKSTNAAAPSSSPAAPRKKPVPRPVAPSKKAEPASAPNADAAPVEKKKPRKLAQRAKPAAAAS